METNRTPSPNRTPSSFILVMSLIFIFSQNQVLFAAGGMPEPSPTQRTPSPSPSSSTSSSSSPTPRAGSAPSPLPTLSGTNGNSIQKSANNDSSGKMIGTVVAGLATMYCGSKAISACGSNSHPECAWWIAGAVTGVAAGIVLTKSKSKSDKTYKATLNPWDHNGNNGGSDYDGGFGGGGGGDGGGDPSSNLSDEQIIGKLPIEFKNTITQLKKNGITIDPKNGTFKTPDGKSFSVNDFASPGSMSRAGLDSSKWGDLNKALEDVKKQADQDARIKLTADSTEEGGRAIPGSKYSSGGPGVEYRMKGLGQKEGIHSGERSSSSNSPKLSVICNGNGVCLAPNENIFNAVSERYKLKDSSLLPY